MKILSLLKLRYSVITCDYICIYIITIPDHLNYKLIYPNVEFILILVFIMMYTVNLLIKYKIYMQGTDQKKKYMGIFCMCIYI